MQSTSPTRNLDRLRDETRGLNNVIHFNNAGASLMADPVYEAVSGYLEEEREFGGYETFNRREAEINGFYSSCARLLNAEENEIAFIENATRAFNMAFYSFPFEPGDVILTSVAEYASNYISYLQLASKKSLQIKVIPNDQYNQTSTDELLKLIDSNVKLIAITHVPTNGGLVNPAKEIGEIARQNNIAYLLDACQSTGQLAIDVKEIGCDFLSATGRKYLRGPRATGFLYVSQMWVERLEPVFLDLHAATWTGKDSYEIEKSAKRFECWEQNFAGKLGLKTAIDYACTLGLDWIETRVLELAAYKRERLSQIDSITVYDAGVKKCGIVSFASNNITASKIAELLKDEKINVSYSTVEGTRLDMEVRELPDLVRSSIHYYNTEEEVDVLINALIKIGA